jgi:hypothetical protein
LLYFGVLENRIDQLRADSVGTFGSIHHDRTQQASLTVNLESSATKKPVVLDLEYKILNVIFDACGWEFCSLEQVEDTL